MGGMDESATSPITVAEQAEAIAHHFARLRLRLAGDEIGTFRGLIESGVIVAGPAVVEGIQETG
jgi:hypothetical protein